MTSLLRRLMISAAGSTLVTAVSTTFAAATGQIHNPVPWSVIAACVGMWALTGVVAIRDHIDHEIDSRIDTARSDVEVRIETCRKHLDEQDKKILRALDELSKRIDITEERETQIYRAGIAVGIQKASEESYDKGAGGKVTWLRQPNGM